MSISFFSRPRIWTSHPQTRGFPRNRMSRPRTPAGPRPDIDRTSTGHCLDMSRTSHGRPLDLGPARSGSTCARRRDRGPTKADRHLSAFVGFYRLFDRLLSAFRWALPQALAALPGFRGHPPVPAPGRDQSCFTMCKSGRPPARPPGSRCSQAWNNNPFDPALSRTKWKHLGKERLAPAPARRP